MSKSLAKFAVIGLTGSMSLMPTASAATVDNIVGSYGSLSKGASAWAARSDFCTFEGTYHLKSDQKIRSETISEKIVKIIRKEAGVIVVVNVDKNISDTRGAVLKVSMFLSKGFPACESPFNLIPVTYFTAKGLSVVTGDEGTPVDFKYTPPQDE